MAHFFPPCGKSAVATCEELGGGGLAWVAAWLGFLKFLGWFVSIKNLKELYSDHVKKGQVKFLLTFKLSLDPLENFLSSIRMSCGKNNNPTSIQFKLAFQSLLRNPLTERRCFVF
jgi:hypothetical protein